METARNKKIKDFQLECFQTLNKKFAIDAEMTITSDPDKYTLEMTKQLKDFMTSLSSLSLLTGEKVGCIEISFLRLSAFEDSLVVAMEAYDERGTLGECLADVTFHLDWNHKEWNELKEGLFSERKKEQWCRWISEEDIKIMMQESLTFLFIQYIFFFKYVFEDCDRWDEYQSLPKASVFMLSIGEYHDKQKLVFVDREEVDIFLCDSDNTLKFCRFNGKVYKQKTFKELDLRYTFFINTVFENCDFRTVDLRDARFYNCRFFRCNFADTKLSGGIVKDCILEECDIESMIWFKQAEPFGGFYEDLYRTTSISDTKVIHSKYNAEEMAKYTISGVTFE